jgi:hypothetical protein
LDLRSRSEARSRSSRRMRIEGLDKGGGWEEGGPGCVGGEADVSGLGGRGVGQSYAISEIVDLRMIRRSDQERSHMFCGVTHVVEAEQGQERERGTERGQRGEGQGPREAHQEQQQGPEAQHRRLLQGDARGERGKVEGEDTQGELESWWKAPFLSNDRM